MTSQYPKQVSIKLEIYDQNMTYIDEFTTFVDSEELNNLTADRSNAIMRSFSFAFDNSDGRFSWGDSSLIWIDKRIKFYIGLKLLNGTVEYVPQGVFILTNPRDSHNLNGKKCYIEGQDKAYLFAGKRGIFQNQTTIESGTNIATAIRIIASAHGETLFNFDITDVITPYEITFEANDNKWDAMTTLAQFGKCELFYDVYGYLRLKYVGDLNDIYNQPVVWTYEYGGENGNCYVGNERILNENLLANHIIAYGGSGETATVRYELIVDEDDSLWANNPYSIQNIGRIIYQHNDGNPDGLLETIDDCKYRCKYELMQRLGYIEEVSLEITPNYLLEPRDIIQIIDLESGVNNRYRINSFDLPIIPEVMVLNCAKEYRVIDDWDFI
jgi:hypothetical protein